MIVRFVESFYSHFRTLSLVPFTDEKTEACGGEILISVPSLRQVKGPSLEGTPGTFSATHNHTALPVLSTRDLVLCVHLKQQCAVCFWTHCLLRPWEISSIPF
jgi:hypothetical protein